MRATTVNLPGLSCATTGPASIWRSSFSSTSATRAANSEYCLIAGLCKSWEPIISELAPMATPLSICMVSDDFLPAATGVGVHLKLVAPELARRGHQVCVITSRRKGEPAIEQWQGVTIYRV